MKAGDRIKVDMGWAGMYSDWQVFTVEEFRHCLGFFASEDHRKAGRFTPLCEVYCDGPDSEIAYISNFGRISNKSGTSLVRYSITNTTEGNR